MKYAELGTLSLEELVKRKRELQASIFEGRMKNAMGQLPNPMTLRFARRDIARINTAMSTKSPELVRSAMATAVSSTGVQKEKAAKAAAPKAKVSRAGAKKKKPATKAAVKAAGTTATKAKGAKKAKA